MASTILVAEDEAMLRGSLAELLTEEGYRVLEAGDGKAAYELVLKEPVDLVLSDVRMPVMDGMTLLRELRQLAPETPVIMITAFGTVESAVAAMKIGAADYLLKPVQFEDMVVRIRRALESHEMTRTCRIMVEQLAADSIFHNLVGRSQSMERLFEMVRKLSTVKSNVLITGESGTGKELLARAIHYNGITREKPFVPVNCGAIPENLVESELFGHRRGAFTGASRDKIGYFEAADGGTLSPLLGFFVFHMVIASLLLPRLMAYVGAAVCGIMLGGGLWFSGQWPAQRHDALVLAGWLISLFIAVYLTSGITRSLRLHRLHVLQQKHRIRTLSDDLRRRERAMIQQDKMVAMGQMAAGVAHEIANPLACMDSYLQLIQRKPDRLREDATDKLREQIGRIDHIVRQLTHFAHPAEAQWQLIPVCDVISRALQMAQFDKRIRDGAVRVHQDVAANSSVSAQTHALEQVLLNLIFNALDAMADEPEPQLSIRAWQDSRQCHIAVSDNGHGISPEHLTRLFDPFFTTKPAGKGTGLGLSISYQLVRSHGGQIEARNLPKGACFTVSLPVATAVS